MNGSASTLWNSYSICEAVEKWQCSHPVGQSCIHFVRQLRNGSASTLWNSHTFCEAVEKWQCTYSVGQSRIL